MTGIEYEKFTTTANQLTYELKETVFEKSIRAVLVDNVPLAETQYTLGTDNKTITITETDIKIASGQTVSISYQWTKRN